MELKVILKRLLIKSIFPIFLFAIVVAIIFGLSKDNASSETFLWAWVMVGLPFGMNRLRSFWVLKNADLGATLAVFVFNFILSGLIGGFVAVYKLITAVFYLFKGIFELVQYKKLYGQNII